MRLKPSISARLPDELHEQVRRNTQDRIDELQSLPASGMRVVVNVALPDGVETPVAHGLERAPIWVSLSPARGGVTLGGIIEIRTSGVDRKSFAVLQAIGWGGPIIVDMAVL